MGVCWNLNLLQEIGRCIVETAFIEPATIGINLCECPEKTPDKAFINAASIQQGYHAEAVTPDANGKAKAVERL